MLEECLPSNVSYFLLSIVLEQWLLTFLEALNPTSSIHAFIEHFVVGKISCAVFSSNSLHMHITVYCISAQTDQAERWVTNHTSG